MQAEDHLRNGDLGQALTALQQAVRDDPSDAKLRVFLFQLLAVMGQWDRALTQLNVVGEMDASAMPMVHAFRAVIACEAFREQVFTGQRSPLILGEPEPWVGALVQANAALGAGRVDQARALREQALAAAPAIGGRINGQPFAWLADGDDRLGPVLEVILEGRYYWAPWQRIASLSLEAPSDLRDVVWMAAQLRWTNGGEAVGFIPTRYAGTAEAGDDALRLARKTDWREAGEGLYVGLGQRMFVTDAAEHAFLEVRSIEMDVDEQASATAPADREAPDA